MTPGRKLVYDFCGLPYITQINIGHKLGLTTDEEETSLNDCSLRELIFNRAYDLGLLDRLRSEIDKAMEFRYKPIPANKEVIVKR